MFVPVVHHEAVVLVLVQPASADQGLYKQVCIALPVAKDRAFIVREPSNIATRTLTSCLDPQQLQQADDSPLGLAQHPLQSSEFHQVWAVVLHGQALAFRNKTFPP